MEELLSSSMEGGEDMVGEEGVGCSGAHVGGGGDEDMHCSVCFFFLYNFI